MTESRDYTWNDVSNIIKIVTAAATGKAPCGVTAVPLKLAISQNTTKPNAHLLSVYKDIKSKLLASSDKSIRLRTLLLDNRLTEVSAEWRLDNAKAN